ncbi:hypothetical protein Hanom_Chr00s001057g01673351 [Helianthus anomalus]
MLFELWLLEIGFRPCCRMRWLQQAVTPLKMKMSPPFLDLVQRKNEKIHTILRLMQFDCDSVTAV